MCVCEGDEESAWCMQRGAYTDFFWCMYMDIALSPGIDFRLRNACVCIIWKGNPRRDSPHRINHRPWTQSPRKTKTHEAPTTTKKERKRKSVREKERERKKEKEKEERR